jgi:hypothetical protein
MNMTNFIFWQTTVTMSRRIKRLTHLIALSLVLELVQDSLTESKTAHFSPFFTFFSYVAPAMRLQNAKTDKKSACFCQRQRNPEQARTFLCWLTMNHFFKVLLYCLCLHVEACAQKIFGTIFMAKHRDLPDIIPSIMNAFNL